MIPAITCPKCIAEAGLAALRTLNEGKPAHVLGTTITPQHGKPLCHSTQAGIGRELLEQIVNATGSTCPRHGGSHPRTRKEVFR